MNISLAQIADHFGITENPDKLLSGWNEAMMTMPEGIPSFLTPDSFLSSSKFCGLDQGTENTLLPSAEIISKDKSLLALSWYVFYCLTEGTVYRTYDKLPSFKKELGDNSGIFFMLLALSLVPGARKTYEKMNIPENIIKDTMKEIEGFNGNHKVANDNRPGILPNQLHWLSNYYKGKLFRLGRFEYKLEPFHFPGTFYRNRKTGQKIGFTPDSIRFDGDGFVDGIGEVFDEKNGWTSSFKEEDGLVSGNPYSPLGFAIKEKKSISLNDWEPALKANDWTIDLHIPPGGGMTPEACRDSFKTAFEFFNTHFPEKKSSAIVCNSWIFNTQFEKLLPDSNMVKFMQELYLFPVQSGGRDGFFFVFCREYANLAEAPRKTSLQKAMLGILESGRKLRSGGMAFFIEDIGKFGKQAYREVRKF
ncbi:MAG TPA: hypothetical protein DCZ94_03905 [Lentisphaeria bacterium]|nr:MAG: hypothetical protein A2X48_05125 [Lentisphaerae bacterium GWF2_49_21]HBC86079.1 hypothetical protein [Lentisphaeria bacterium]